MAHPRFTITEARRSRSEQIRRREHWYFALMGVCVALIAVAWTLVRLWSTDAAVVMSVVAAVIPPIAAIVANAGSRDL